jgi:hypothetical protein
VNCAVLLPEIVERAPRGEQRRDLHRDVEGQLIRDHVVLERRIAEPGVPHVLVGEVEPQVADRVAVQRRV